ncbi:MAG: HAD family phosphatase [Anaerolineae bacterium]|nr:HAD family phosphatase [Anaerolineae bacterium]
MTVKLIACDLDGTLVGEDLTFSPRLLRAVRCAQAMGVVVTLATGRGFASALNFARKLGTGAPLICYQGALLRTQSGETLHQTSLSREHLPGVIAFCEQQGWELTVYSDDQVYYTARVHDQAYYERWFSLPAHFVDDLLAALPGDPIKFIIIADSKARGDQLEADLRALAGGRFSVTRSHDWFVEGVALEASKGDALARLACRLGIDQAQVMALGDSGNDRSMVAWAGVGVAMGNALAEVKAVADVIAPPQAEDGAAWAIERYVLENGR